MLEKLLTDRSGEKGARDLLAVAGILAVTSDAEIEQMIVVAGTLSPDARHAIKSNLTLLSLMDGRPGMPDPTRCREAVATSGAVRGRTP